MSLTFLEKLEARGEAKGEARGEAKGEVRGEAKGKTAFGRNAVLSVLRKRFNKVPLKIETMIQQMNDPIALELLVIDAATCQTLDEFSKAVR
ncbi:MAG: hypothetical protein LBE12_13945 [Planctomycetaceae bacterium]|jgi:predicted transposase YdaD|nr:hypothetical protein [Planctomycetaceae bacterium]